MKVMAGNPGKRRLNAREPKPGGQPVAPDWLSDDARKEWDRTVPELERLGLLSVVDGAALVGHCCNYARAVQAERTLQREGLILDGKKHPAATVAKECWQLVRSFASEFGLTSSSRARLTTGGEDQGDALGLFIAAKPKGA